MAETREQFRERIGYLNLRASWGRKDTKFLRELWSMDPNDNVKHCNAAEAVYAEALRDVLALMRDRDVVAGRFVLTVPTVTDDDLMNFAAERGIDLEG